MSLESKENLEKWYEKQDPWGYETNPEDLNRRAMLLSVIPQKPYARVLDIGCGNGFVTGRLPGDSIIGIDLSTNAITYARNRKAPHIEYLQKSFFELQGTDWNRRFDLIVVTGVLYPQYIGEGRLLAYTLLDELLEPGGHLVCAHILEWYQCRFPYITMTREYYPYREFTHILEVYVK